MKILSTELLRALLQERPGSDSALQELARDAGGRRRVVDDCAALLDSDDDIVRRGAVLALGPDHLAAREQLPRWRSVMCDDRAPKTLRASAFCLVVSLEPHSAPIERLVTVFVDVLMESGNIARAFSLATDSFAQRKRLLRKPRLRGDVPSTRGSASIRGHELLVLRPYPYRSCIGAALRALARFAEAEPRLAAWLIEGAKLWSAEREIALRALRSLGLADQALPELVRFVASKTGRRSGKILSSALELARDDAAWFLSLVSALAASEEACARLGSSMSGRELGELLCDDWPPAFAGLESKELDQLRALAASAPAVVSVLSSLALLGAGKASWARQPLTGLLKSELGAGPWEMLVSALLRHEMYDEELLSAARAVARAEPFSYTGRHRNRPTLEGADGAWLLPATRVDELYRLGDHFVGWYHRVRTLAPGQVWCNDEDELGVVVVSLAPVPTVDVVALPVRFGLRPNGANLAKRRIADVIPLDGQLCAVWTSPYCTPKAWGSESFVFTFEPGQRVFYQWHAQSGIASASALSAAREDELSAASVGEVVVWVEDGQLHLCSDRTSYHLDDWRQSDDVVEAMARRQRSRSGRHPADAVSAPKELLERAARDAGGLTPRDTRCIALDDGWALLMCRFGDGPPELSWLCSFRGPR